MSHIDVRLYITDSQHERPDQLYAQVVRRAPDGETIACRFDYADAAVFAGVAFQQFYDRVGVLLPAQGKTDQLEARIYQRDDKLFVECVRRSRSQNVGSRVDRIEVFEGARALYDQLESLVKQGRFIDQSISDARQAAHDAAEAAEAVERARVIMEQTQENAQN